MAADNLKAFIESMRLSNSFDICICSESEQMAEYLMSIVERIGLPARKTSIEHLSTSQNKKNVLIIDHGDSKIADWLRTQNSPVLDAKNSRIICLRESTLDFTEWETPVSFSRRPFIEGSFLRTLHEVILRLSMKPSRLGKPGAVPIAQKFPMTILIAEDSLLNLQMLVKTLNKMGYDSIITAHDGQEAVEMYKARYQSNNPVDLIFMDVQMPVLDGCGASLKIREFLLSYSRQGKHGPHIIAMTANSFQEDRQACLRSGMCRFASKPVQWELLEQLIEEGFGALSGRHTCRCQSPALASW